MPFQPSIPQPTDFLSDSQNDLLQNNLQLDVSFGIDHYTFSDGTADNGKHNYVTTPKAVNVPPTVTGHPDITATQLRFYAMQDTVELGLLQYSRGWDTLNATSAVPSPLTRLHSTATALTMPAGPATINLMDFTNVKTLAFLDVYVTNFEGGGSFVEMGYHVTWRGSNTAPSSFRISQLFNSSLPNIVIGASGNILQIQKTGAGAVALNQLYWTMSFLRIQPA